MLELWGRYYETKGERRERGEQKWKEEKGSG